MATDWLWRPITGIDRTRAALPRTINHFGVCRGQAVAAIGPGVAEIGDIDGEKARRDHDEERMNHPPIEPDLDTLIRFEIALRNLCVISVAALEAASRQYRLVRFPDEAVPIINWMTRCKLTSLLGAVQRLREALETDQ